MDTEYLKKVGLYILTVILSLGVLFYIGYHIWDTFTRDVETAPVKEFTAENTVSCDAYIFRNESSVARTTSGGSIVSAVRDGEKVQSGDAVAKVYAAGSPQTVAEIAEIDQRLELLESCVGTGSVSLKESTKIESDIYDVLSDLRAASGVGDAEAAQELRSSLITLLGKRAILAGGDSAGYGAEIETLRAKKQSLSGSLEGCLETVSSPVSGYYYSVADGYEGLFSATALEDITYDGVKTLLDSTPKSTDGVAGKIVTDSFWYAVCPIDRSHLETYKAGDSCQVRFAGELSLSMEVFRVLSGSDGVLLILRTNYLPNGFSFARIQKVSLVTDVCRGLKIPVGSVRVVNGETGVYVLDGVTVRFRKIKTLLKNDAYYVVAPEPEKNAEENTSSDTSADTSGDGTSDGNKTENKTKWLRFHDNLIVEGKGLFDGKVVG